MLNGLRLDSDGRDDENAVDGGMAEWLKAAVC
jgi:hypothetical protein